MEQDNIDWNRYFDHIYCIFFVKNMPHKERLVRELSRVGILQSGIFEWKVTVPCCYDKTIIDSFDDKSGIAREGWVNESLAYLDVLKCSEILGHQRVLILEDDVAFLRDKEMLQKKLEAIPDGFGAVQFDHAFARIEQKEEWASLEKERTVNSEYIDCTGHWFGMGTANAYFGEGIKEAIRVLEEKPIVIDTIARHTSMKWAICKKSAAIQVITPQSITGARIGAKMHEVYGRAEVDYSKYNLPDGYNNKSVFNGVQKI